jgi:hypothetical protein
MNDLITRLVARYKSGAACASALGISRQAFNAAMQRGSLSDNVALRAVDLLSTPKDPPAPIISAAPDLACDSANNTNYARFEGIKKTAKAVTICPHVHVITSQKQKDAVDLIRWVLAVAKLPADSPRFNWYVSRWAVPEKISAAKKAGTFAGLVANCPPIDPAWVRFVPGALQACADFAELIKPPNRKTPLSSSNAPGMSKRQRAAA